VAAVKSAETLNVTDPLPFVVAVVTGAALIPVGNPLAVSVMGIFAVPPLCVTLMVMFPVLFWSSDSELAKLNVKSAAATVVKETGTVVV
jgi:hypothetical protein